MIQLSSSTNGTAVAIQSGAMEADTISNNGRISKSQMSRRKMSILTAVFLLVLQIVGIQGCMLLKEISESSKYNHLHIDFDNSLKERGFEKRIVVYDFFSESRKKDARLNMHWWTVGIWLNYQEQQIALRTERLNWDEIVIPFDKIQKVTITEDGQTVTTGRVGYFGGVRASSNEISKGLDVRIVSGDMSTGTNAYILKLYDPKYGATLQKSDPNYKSIQECANSIVDAIELIMKNN